jgi:hypothetical protein
MPALRLLADHAFETHVAALLEKLSRTFLGDRFINMEMVRDGFAWRYVQYDKPGEFTEAEQDAREAKPRIVGRSRSDAM